MVQWPVYAYEEERRITARTLKPCKEDERLYELVSKAIKQLTTMPPTPCLPTLDLPKLTEIPEIQEPTCLFTAYQLWQQQQRAYFTTHNHPPWKKQFGDRAVAIKLRYSRMRPYLMYLDKQGPRARECIQVLDEIRQEKKISPSVFIKQCFYHMVYPPAENVKKPPPVSPYEMRELLKDKGLQIPY